MIARDPTFAVVGHPNKGKSAIVATLAEDEGVAISDVPGTTTSANSYSFAIEGVTHYVLVDTPGFQRAGAVLRWLEAHDVPASERPETVARFVSEHADDPGFRDECELLAPILAGSGILYVVDGSKPYGPEFEAEMEILRWTGQPRMALVNLIGEGDYLDEWRQGLGQFFSIVRVYDAMRAEFKTRLALLGAFGELQESWRPRLDAAVAALHRERARRFAQSAADIAAGIADCLHLAERRALRPGEASEEVREQVLLRLKKRIADRERQMRDAVQANYRHERLQRDEAPSTLVDMDLFTDEGWELFGLSKTQLVITGTFSGALAGFGVDALVGGASLLLGAGVGAVLGGATTWFGSGELAKTEVLGTPLGGDVLKVGPVTAPNFPWVLLGRAWAHHQLVAERNHAFRERLTLGLSAEGNLMDQVDEDLRRDLAKAIAEVRRSAGNRGAADRLAQSVARLLALDLILAD